MLADVLLAHLLRSYYCSYCSYWYITIIPTVFLLRSDCVFPSTSWFKLNIILLLLPILMYFYHTYWGIAIIPTDVLLSYLLIYYYRTCWCIISYQGLIPGTTYYQLRICNLLIMFVVPSTDAFLSLYWCNAACCCIITYRCIITCTGAKLPTNVMYLMHIPQMES